MFADTHLVLVKDLWLISLMLLVRPSPLMISSNPAESSPQVRRSAEPPGSGGFCPPHASAHQCRRKLGGVGLEERVGGSDYQKESEKG